MSDRNTFFTQPSRDIKHVAGKGEVKFSTSRTANEFESNLGLGEGGRSNRSLRSPSRVMQALGRNPEEWSEKQVEETPDSLNRRGQPGVMRMKHGAKVLDGVGADDADDTHDEYRQRHKFV